MTTTTTTYLVTGGAGFIGSNLVAHLRRERPDATIRVVDNLATGKRANLAEFTDDPRVVLTQASVTHRPTMEQLLDGVDTVFHLAALPSVPVSLQRPIDTDMNNVHATVVLLESMRRVGTVRRLVYAGSSSAYGNRDERSLGEELIPLPESPYAASKLAGEFYLRAFTRSLDLDTVAVRFFNVFGPRQNPNSPYSAVIPKFIARMMAGEPPVVYGDGMQSRDFTFVENVCHGVLLASEAPAEAVKGRVFNVACGDSTTLLDLVARLNAILGTTLEPQFEPARPGDVKWSLADIRRAREAFGYEVRVPFAAGLERTVEWYRTAAEREMVEAGRSTPIRT